MYKCSIGGVMNKLGNMDGHVIEYLMDVSIECGALMVRRSSVSCNCLLYTSPSPRDGATSRMPSSA